MEDLADIEHPLASNWSMWFNTPSHKLQKLYTLDTVESFWRLHNTINEPSLIEPGSSYYLFVSSTRPAIEDKSHAEGGKWVMDVTSDNVDQQWMFTCLLLIGGMLENSDIVTGCAIINKEGSLSMEVWSGSSNREQNNDFIDSFKSTMIDMEQVLHSEFKFVPFESLTE
eukprot:TRINITY_DN774184_c0_g1_i1.p1 TRINITY_DN774184_c0_g1~~TRINITY_DN774184_c0_g1_i1.p1  ORF type:complete len:169 (+),score=45.77 TRINITY_DN774184_c0_g1_i1:125-631(+)